MVLFTVLTERGRAAFDRIDPWIVIAALLAFLFVHLLWLEGSADSLTPTVARLREAAIAGENTLSFLRLLAVLLLAQVGLVILALVAGGQLGGRGDATPPLSRGALDPFASLFVKVFALLPPLLAAIGAVVLARPLPIGGTAPLLVLSGLAAIVLAGESVRLCNQRLLGFAWAALLFLPAALVPAAMIALPWTLGVRLSVAEPAAAMGRFFAETFQKRTGRPLKIVTGDADTAALVALTAPSRPSVYFDSAPARSPAITATELRKDGAVVVWLSRNGGPALPPVIKAHFPGLVAEIPRIFEPQMLGRQPSLRVGWAVIRPAPASAKARTTTR
jgi:hypothetical protein